MKQIFETSPVESILYPGYYHSDKYYTVVVSPDGKVKNLLANGDFLEVSGFDSQGYPYVCVPLVATVSIHRLLGLIFLECPGDPDELVINHKDGDKNNHSLDNLEWATYSENLRHAYMNDLRSDNKKILAKDLETEKIREFYSLQEAARFFDMNGAHLSIYLNNRSEKVPFAEKWELIFKGEEWRGLTEDDIGVARKGVAKKVVTVSLDGKKYTVYDNMGQMASILGVSHATVSYWVTKKGGSKHRGFKVYYYHELRNKKDLDIEYIKCDKVKKPRSKGNVRKPVPIRVTNMKTGVVKDWVSVEQFANSVGMLKATIQRRVWITGNRWSHYIIEYLEKTKRSEERVLANRLPLEKSID